jgi:hypothetical protein
MKSEKGIRNRFLGDLYGKFLVIKKYYMQIFKQIYYERKMLQKKQIKQVERNQKDQAMIIYQAAGCH